MRDSTLANLFVVGAMRAGTTSFMEILGNHPAIYISPIKEPHYFVNHLPKHIYGSKRRTDLNSYFDKKPLKKVHLVHVTQREHYDMLFTSATKEVYRAEGSTCYLHAPGVAEAIKEYNPEAKIIIITRDPISRAYSHFKMDQGLARTRKSFEEVLEDEWQQYCSGTLPWSSYLNMGRYVRQISRFQECFNDVLLLSFRGLYKDGTDWDAVWQFLALSPVPIPVIQMKNQSRKLKALPLYSILYKTLAKEYFSKFASRSFKEKLLDLFSNGKADELPISSELHSKLIRFYENEYGKDGNDPIKQSIE